MSIKEEMKEKLLELKTDLEYRLSKIKDHRKRGIDGAQNEEDAAQVESGEEVIDKLEKTERDTLVNVTAALLRVENGSYGACIICDDEITDRRLKAIPYTTMCEVCAEDAENQR